MTQIKTLLIVLFGMSLVVACNPKVPAKFALGEVVCMHTAVMRVTIVSVSSNSYVARLPNADREQFWRSEEDGPGLELSTWEGSICEQRGY